MEQQPLLGFAIILRHTTLDRLLWRSNLGVAKNSTWQNTTLTTDWHPRSRRHSNPQSQ